MRIRVLGCDGLAVSPGRFLCPGPGLLPHVYSEGGHRRTAVRASGVNTRRVPRMSLSAQTHRHRLPSKALMEHVSFSRRCTPRPEMTSVGISTGFPQRAGAPCLRLCGLYTSVADGPAQPTSSQTWSQNAAVAVCQENVACGPCHLNFLPFSQVAK